MKLNKETVTAAILKIIKTLIIPVGIWLFFAVATQGRTVSTRMFLTTLRQSVVPTAICCGLMLSMSMGMMNFAGGAMVLSAGIIGGNLGKPYGLIGIVIGCVLVCLLEGIVTGFLYVKLRVPCMVLTLGLMLFLEALPRIPYTGGINLTADLTILSRKPYCYYILAIMLIAFYILFDKTAFGHNVRAIGNNQVIANNAGINLDKTKFLSFVFGSIFLGVAAFLYISENGEVFNQSALGSMTIMMDGFMGMFLAMFLSQYCNMSIAIVLGSFCMKMLSNGLVSMGFSSTIRDIIQGVFLLVLLTISANSGLFERMRADKEYAAQCRAERAAQKAQ